MVEENNNITHMRLQVVNISFKYGLPIFNPNEEKSVIFRPFQRIIKNGKETGYISYIFLNTFDNSRSYAENEIDLMNEFTISQEFQAQTFPEKTKVLGCICHTKGNKILFYPSFPTSYLTKFKDRNKPERHIENITIDHFSLEPSFEKWHITHLDGHFKNLKTHKIDDNIIHWFSMSIDSKVELEQVYQLNTFAYCCKVSDAERRIQDIASAVKNYGQDLITAPISDKYDKDNSFYHFDFYIKVDSSIESKKLGIFHIPSSCILNMSESETIQWTSNEMDVPKFYGKLVIVATKMTGKLTDNVILTCLT